MAFKKAVKHDAKLRLALSGPAGSGKTYSALSIAKHLGGPIALVDTEHGSASKYADLFDFDVIEPGVFDPRELIETMYEAAKEGYRVIVIDSLSHYWMGKGGELEMVDAAAKRTQGNSFAAWKHVTPVHNQLVDTIISAPLHVIVTMRTKTEWVVEQVNGKSTPRKIGLAPIMRDGIEFEFDVCGEIDADNTLTVTKSRCPALSGAAVNRPGKQVAETLNAWLKGVAPAQKPTTPAAPEDPIAEVMADAIAETLATMKDKFSALKVFASLKKDIEDLVGNEAPYYEILSKHGVSHSNEFKSLKPSQQAAKDMMEYMMRCRSAVSEPAA